MRYRLITLAVGALIALGMTATAADAQEPALSFPINVLTIGAPGTTVPLASAPTGAHAGQTCDVAVDGGNNSSVHPGNDLIVTSNGDAVVLPNFERAPDAVTEARTRLTLGDTLALAVRLSPTGNGRSSGGAIVTLSNCTAPPPPPTTPTTAPPAAPPTVPSQPPTVNIGTPVPATTPPASTLPHTGSELWLTFIGAGGLVTGLVIRARSARRDWRTG